MPFLKIVVAVLLWAAVYALVPYPWLGPVVDGVIPIALAVAAIAVLFK